MIYSGVDWSGDVGDPAKGHLSPYFIVAIAHVNGDDLALLERTLGNMKDRRRLPSRFAFRHSHCSDQIRGAFFEVIRQVPVTLHASVYDKRTWTPDQFRRRGWDIINRLLADLVCGCPAAMIAGQVILVDQPKNETKAVRATAAAVKMALRGKGVSPLPQIKPCPDHRTQGLIVQVADMFAGALHQTAGEVRGRPLEGLAHRIVLL